MQVRISEHLRLKLPMLFGAVDLIHSFCVLHGLFRTRELASQEGLVARLQSTVQRLEQDRSLQEKVQVPPI